jgi:hypothetical protein
MATRAHFRVTARFDTSGLLEGTVTINRMTGLFTVRPLRRHRTYELPLSAVADMVVSRVIRGEVLERWRRKRKKQTGP